MRRLLQTESSPTAPSATTYPPERSHRSRVLRSPGQQSANAVTASQIRELANETSPTRSTNNDTGRTTRLSKLAAHARSSPSSGPRATSVGMCRTRLVIGATTTRVSRSMTELRVMTSTGRRLSSDSAHQMSPCRGRSDRDSPRLVVTTAPPESSPARACERRPSPPRIPVPVRNQR